MSHPANRSIPIEADRGDAERAFGGPLKTIIGQKKPKRFRIDSNLITFPVSFVFIHVYSREIGRDKYGIGRDRNRRSEIRDPKIRD